MADTIQIIDVLTDEQAESARHLTFPAYAAYVGTQDGKYASFAAVDGGQVVGLALWWAGTSGRLLSIMVVPEYRRRGVGAKLLAASASALGTKLETATTYWSSRLPGAEAFEALLRKSGWDAKHLDERRVSGTAQSARDWAHRRRMDRMLARTGWSFASFAETDAAEKDAITARAKAEGIPDDWQPFTDVAGPRQVVPDLSIIMRQHGQVVGWLVTCRIENGDIWYYRLHNIGAGKGSGALMPLIVEVNRRHFLLDGPDARWRWNTNGDRPDMLAFLARHAPQFCDFYDDYWCSSLQLRVESDDAVGQTDQIGTVG